MKRHSVVTMAEELRTHLVVEETFHALCRVRAKLARREPHQAI